MYGHVYIHPPAESFFLLNARPLGEPGGARPARGIHSNRIPMAFHWLLVFLEAVQASVVKAWMYCRTGPIVPHAPHNCALEASPGPIC